MDRMKTGFTPPPAPFHHPAYESARDRDRREWQEEIARDSREFDVMRDRYAAARILESGWPV